MAKTKVVARRIILGIAGFFVLLEIIGYGLEWLRPAGGPDGSPEGKTTATAKDVEAKIAQLENRLRFLAPRGIQVVIDTAENKLRVMNGSRLAHEAVVSCGSGDILDDPGGKRRWQFDTPRGEFIVTSKLVNPTWIKPDWAFIEEGEKPPTKFDERIDNDSLGDYALGFGDGFFIHGTLYTRLLGRNVTHGCVRVGDKDLKEVFRLVPMGARIFIY
jgi:lipoprotein-anchoring transpeptidase ErfK/SrfK